MRSRALRLLVLLWSVFWFVAYVPGHQRGRVLMPGAEKFVEGGGCCGPKASAPPAEPVASCHAAPTASSENSPSKSQPIDRINHCAVCFVSANTQTTPTIVFHPPPVTLLGEICPPPLASLQSLASIDRAKARDPPTALPTSPTC